MALVEFKNLPDTSTPLNAQNLNNNFELLSNQIALLSNQMTITCSDTSITTTLDQKREDIPLDTVLASVGDKLTLNTANNKYEIKIGSGVSYVSVSAGYSANQTTSGATYIALTILKNGSQYGKWANAKGNPSNPNVYLYTSMSDILIPVQQGDAIALAIFIRVAGTVSITNPYLSVKVVA